MRFLTKSCAFFQRLLLILQIPPSASPVASASTKSKKKSKGQKKKGTVQPPNSKSTPAHNSKQEKEESNVNSDDEFEEQLRELSEQYEIFLRYQYNYFSQLDLATYIVYVSYMCISVPCVGCPVHVRMYYVYTRMYVW